MKMSLLEETRKAIKEGKPATEIAMKYISVGKGKKRLTLDRS